MRLQDAIYNRVTIRKFKDKSIPKEQIRKIIDAAIRAPSACNIQGWKYIIISDSKLKIRLISAGTISFIKNAPIGVLMLYENQNENIAYHDNIQSAAASIQNMILTAHSMGIGCCWICHLPRKKELRKILNIPKQYDPIAYIAMGYYLKEPKPMPRKYSVDEVVSYNKFIFDKISNKNKLLGLKRIIISLYRFMPFKNSLLPFTKKFEKFN